VTAQLEEVPALAVLAGGLATRHAGRVELGQRPTVTISQVDATAPTWQKPPHRRSLRAARSNSRGMAWVGAERNESSNGNAGGSRGAAK
jgi:hypothetical protein